MPDRQVTPYERLSKLYIEAVARDELPVIAVCKALQGVDYGRLSRRLCDVRLGGWLPRGRAVNTPEWLDTARSMRANRLAEVELAKRERREQLDQRLDQEKKQKAATAAQRAERALSRKHAGRARLERKAQLAEECRLEHETAKQRRRLWRDVSTPDAWLVRFWGSVEVGGPQECWLWTGALTDEGYGRTTMLRTTEHGQRTTVVNVHRAAWLTLRGPVEVGLTLDHVCHNVDLTCQGGPSCVHRRCCNPAHLDPVPAEVVAGHAGVDFRDRLACANGHSFAEHGRWWTPKSGKPAHRVCNACAKGRYDRKVEVRRRRELAAGTRAAVLDVFVGAL